MTQDEFNAQDDLLISISDGTPLSDSTLRLLPPWRAVLIARVASRAGVPLEHGTLNELVGEATRIGGASRLATAYLLDAARRGGCAT
jgi:hypothetical protein